MAAVTAAEAVKAIIKAKGFISAASKHLNITRRQMHNIINKFPTVKEALLDEREKMKDFAEAKLLSNIKEGKEVSLIFYLKTQAKDRGYVERQEVTGKDGNALEIKSINVSKLTDEQVLQIAGGESPDIVFAAPSDSGTGSEAKRIDPGPTE